VSFQVLPAWKQVTPALEQELLAFWQRNNAIAIADASRAAERARQAVCIGRDADGGVCAVGTAVLRTLPRLRQPTYYYRQFFDAAHRGQRQAIPFANQAKAILQAYNAGLERPESLGMLIEVESRQLADRYTLAHEPESGYGFIGYSPRGLVLRVSWFDGATLQPPAPTLTKSRKHQTHQPQARTANTHTPARIQTGIPQ
jgi:hypothetical protein